MAHGMGATGDPILPLLGGEGGPRLPTAALGQAGDVPGFHRRSPSFGAEEKGLTGWTPEPR